MTSRCTSILGHAITHELGHLLLGVGSHSAAGVMHGPWHRKGQCFFTRWEGDRIRREVSARKTIKTSSFLRVLRGRPTASGNKGPVKLTLKQ